MGLGLGIYATPHGEQLLDCLPFLRSLELSTGPHGFQDATADLRLSLDDAFRLYDRPGFPYLLAYTNGQTVWEGRLEDPDLSFSRTDGGIRARAFGAWRALSDVPYLSVWSTTRTDGFAPYDISASYATKMFCYDTESRVFIGLTKGSVYGTGTMIGNQVLITPATAARGIIAVTFDYSVLLPNNFKVRCNLYNDGFADFINPWDHTANGSSQTGSQSLSFAGTPRTIVEFAVYNNTGGNVTHTTENGDNFVKITNLRIKSTASANVYADEIIGSLVGYVNGINSAQLSASTQLIESPALDLKDEVYEDESPADILTRLAGYGDNQTPPRQWETGVWENRVLHFRPKGSAARAWYVDLGALRLSRSADRLRNSAYAVYRDAAGRTLRTATSTDADSVARWAVTRRAPVRSSTTSATQAAVHRDAFIADWKDPRPAAEFGFDALYDQYGNRWPLWMCRAGDTLSARNLRTTLSAAVDRIRTFRISETRWRGVRGQGQTLAVTPEEPLPGLEVLIARQAKGF